MKLELTVKMTPGALYDYLLYNCYTGFQGILGAIIGIFLIVVFISGQSPVFLICGIVIEAYLPYSLFLASRRQFLNTPAFREPLNYVFDDEGVTVSQGENSETQEWETMYKAVSTPKSIILYTSKFNASIFPKKDLEDKKALLIEAISTHMPPKKVKIRG